MGWFTPKLEPGERVVLRSPSIWWRWVMPIAWCLYPAYIWLGINLTGGGPWPDDPQDWLVLKFYVGQGVVFGGLYFILYRWRLLVTDRRLIIRTGWLRREVEIIPLDRIDGLRPCELPGDFEVLCGNDVVSVKTGLVNFSQLYKALGLPGEPGRIYETDIRKMLELGERVVARQGKTLGAELWAVTNRRFLHMPGGFAEVMNLEDIREVVNEPLIPRVILRGDGREISIRCVEDEAKKILAALGREPAEVMA